MTAGMKQLINDTLKSPEGKWSRKSLTMFTSFVVAIIMGFYIVIKYEQAATEIFYGFILLSGGTSVLALYDKIKGKQINKED